MSDRVSDRPHASEREDYYAKELAAARKLKSHVEQLRANEVWIELEASLKAEIENLRAQYETAQGRTIDELVQNEASRGAIATARRILEFPEIMRVTAQNLIDHLTQKEQRHEPQDQ